MHNDTGFSPRAKVNSHIFYAKDTRFCSFFDLCRFKNVNEILYIHKHDKIH